VLIDPYQTDWLVHLTERHVNLPDGANLMLLLDGAFVPGMFREFGDGYRPILLFESFPGCSEETREVSPFILQFDPSNTSACRILSRCSGWPMVSAIATYESAEQLSARLAAWCVVEVDGQRFNFRFPDTRRLPMIFEKLTQQQRSTLVGEAVSWDFIGRNGRWCPLSIDAFSEVMKPIEYAQLDEHQFAALVADSETDEVWVRLLDRGIESALLPSQRHALLSNALSIADTAGCDMSMKLQWCAECLATYADDDIEMLQTPFAEWLHKQSRNDDEALHYTA